MQQSQDAQHLSAYWRNTTITVHPRWSRADSKVVCIVVW